MCICWICFFFLLVDWNYTLHPLDFLIQERRVREAGWLFPCQQSVCTKLVQETLWMDIMQCCPPQPLSSRLERYNQRKASPSPFVCLLLITVNETDESHQKSLAKTEATCFLKQVNYQWYNKRTMMDILAFQNKVCVQYICQASASGWTKDNVK